MALAIHWTFTNEDFFSICEADIILHTAQCAVVCFRFSNAVGTNEARRWCSTYKAFKNRVSIEKCFLHLLWVLVILRLACLYLTTQFSEVTPQENLFSWSLPSRNALSNPMIAVNWNLLVKSNSPPSSRGLETWFVYHHLWWNYSPNLLRRTQVSYLMKESVLRRLRPISCFFLRDWKRYSQKLEVKCLEPFAAYSILLKLRIICLHSPYHHWFQCSSNEHQPRLYSFLSCVNLAQWVIIFQAPGALISVAQCRYALCDRKKCSWCS